MSRSPGTAANLRYRVLRVARILVQFSFLLSFFFLFVKTDYTGSDSLQYAVNILFRLDPLLAVTTMLAVKTLIALMLPALLVAAASLVVGRAFCGWFCPLGSLLDFFHLLIRPRRVSRERGSADAAKVVLIVLLVSALFGVALAGYIDPFSILVRGLSQALYPGMHYVSVSFFTWTYQQAPAGVNAITEPLYEVMQQTILPADQKYYQFGLVSLLILGLVFLVEFYRRRFFCRSICPLGALLGWISRLGLLRIDGGTDACGRCRRCISICRTGAIAPDRTIESERCIICMDCFQDCPRQVISFGGALPASRGLGVSLSRRRFIGAALSGLVLPSVLGTRTLAKRADPALIRPPGALAETEFLRRCVRCGQCMQVCITNALQPDLFLGGIEALFSPVLVARTGYCEFNCTLCGQLCPTGAIQSLSLEYKQQLKIGHAWFDKNFCLPYAKSIACIVCEEHCPTPEKAIRFKSVEVKDEQGVSKIIRQPFIVDELCIGCGICETKCPLPGRSAIFVTSDGEYRHPDNRLPTNPANGFGAYGG